ncbi:MAG: hypothetical protein NC300_00255 [Bacteroidales bacterium]|nr:hypothetical protein [Clostridium sp.]MCM1202554.1 hypothetical protein [Bacteroidales bacterium]
MNNTDKAKLDAAKRMLKGKIDIEEVSMMIGLPVEVLQPVKEEIEEEFRKVYGNTDAYDFNLNQVLYDNYDDVGDDSDIIGSEE